MEHLARCVGRCGRRGSRDRLGGRGRGPGLGWWFRVGPGAWPRVGPCAIRGVVARKTPHRFRPRTAEPRIESGAGSASPLGEGEERSRLRNTKGALERSPGEGLRGDLTSASEGGSASLSWRAWDSAISRARMRRRELLRSMVAARSGARSRRRRMRGWRPWVSSSRVRRLRSSGSGGVAPSGEPASSAWM